MFLKEEPVPFGKTRHFCRSRLSDLAPRGPNNRFNSRQLRRVTVVSGYPLVDFTRNSHPRASHPVSNTWTENSAGILYKDVFP
jgi:hypothetical protein